MANVDLIKLMQAQMGMALAATSYYLRTVGKVMQ